MDYAGAMKMGFAVILMAGFLWFGYRIRKEIREAVIAEALRLGAEKRDDADEILAQPVAKGGFLLARMRARAVRKLREQHLDK
jgi:hypothetical protein